MTNAALYAMIPVFAMSLVFLIVLGQTLRIRRDAELLRASAAPILILLVGLVILGLDATLRSSGGYMNPFTITQALSFAAMLGIFISADAGRRKEIDASLPEDVKSVKFPKWTGKKEMRVSLAREITAGVRGVRNAGMMVGIFTVGVLQAFAFWATTIPDLAHAFTMSPEVVYAGMEAGHIVRAGEDVLMMTDGLPVVIYHCDTLEASFWSREGVSSPGVAIVAERLCALTSETPAGVSV